MRHFPRMLDRAESDALAARLEDRRAEDGIGLAVAPLGPIALDGGADLASVAPRASRGGGMRTVVHGIGANGRAGAAVA
jgi:hypothetical protein